MERHGDTVDRGGSISQRQGCITIRRVLEHLQHDREELLSDRHGGGNFTKLAYAVEECGVGHARQFAAAVDIKDF